MSPTSARARRVGVAALTLLASLLAAELCVRLRFADEVDAARLQAREEATRITPFVRRSLDPELGFELAPGVELEWHGTHVRIHPEEPRRIERGPEPAEEGALRLAVIGDSTAFGWGVEVAQSYAELVRAGLEARSGRRVVLRNWATPGFNSRQNRVTYRDQVRAWRPEILLVHYDHNDTAPNEGPATRGLAPAFGDNPLHSALLKLLRRRLEARALEDASSGPGAGENELLMGFRTAGPEYEQGLAELAELGRAARADGLVPLLLVFNAGLVREDAGAPAWPRTEAERARLEAADRRAFARLARSVGFRELLHAPLAARAAAMGFEVLDTYAPAQERMRMRGWDSLRPLWLSREDNHPGPEGHAFLAELVLAALAAREPYRTLTAPAAR